MRTLENRTFGERAFADRTLAGTNGLIPPDPPTPTAAGSSADYFFYRRRRDRPIIGPQSNPLSADNMMFTADNNSLTSDQTSF